MEDFPNIGKEAYMLEGQKMLLIMYCIHNEVYSQHTGNGIMHG